MADEINMEAADSYDPMEGKEKEKAADLRLECSDRLFSKRPGRHSQIHPIPQKP